VISLFTGSIIMASPQLANTPSFIRNIAVIPARTP
jgi:hypothetical protein